jgi:DNA-binding beta-propeller fold protein YncE
VLLDRAAQNRAAPRRLWPTDDPARDRGVGVPAGDPSCTEPPAASAFAPHGLASAPTETPSVVRIAVVGHGREAVELFDLAGNGDSATLAWRGCVPLPPHTVGNDVSLAADGAIVVSNYMPARAGWHSLFYTLKSGLGWNTGDVMEWHRGSGWRHLAGTAAPGPNGVFVSPDGATVLAAETGSGLVSRVPRAGVSPGSTAEHVKIGGNPDNLSLSPRGTIFVVTHTDGAAFLLCVFGRLPCRTGWSLFEIDPATLRATLLLHHDGSAVGAVASAAEYEGWVYFGSVFDDRIGVWRRPSSS